MSLFSDFTLECETSKHDECQSISACQCGCHKPMYFIKDPKTGCYLGVYGEDVEVDWSGIQL